MISEYDKDSVDSIYNYAKLLTGKSLDEVTQIPIDALNIRSRGNLGTLVEKYFFKYEPTNIHRPDFETVGLELKTTGLIKDSKGKLKAKERLVLTMINYDSISKETWESSTFLAKCKFMLILFYLYQKDKPATKLKFPINPLLYEMPKVDISIIKSDWELIKQKVVEGRAHEISEGDTFYLGACRKGSGGDDEALQNQPFSPIRAKSRAFSFKQSYLNMLIAGHMEETNLIAEDADVSIEEATYRRLKPFIGKTIQEISYDVNYPQKSNRQKNFKYHLLLKVLSGGKGIIPELEKAGIEMKTVTVTKSGRPKEHMSFPGFKFMEIINEHWVNSSFYEKIEKKFLLVIFELTEDGHERLIKAGYWNMPYNDRNEARRVWEETKRRVAINAKDLPKASESYVSYVRPKARNSKDKIPTPQGEMHVRQCFWLNQNYLHKVINEQLE